MVLRLATNQDNSRLIEFYSQFEVKSPIDLKFFRYDFSAPYRLNSNEYKTLILEEDDKIYGLASFVIKNVKLVDREIKVLMGCDLRISNHRKAIMEWSKHFLKTLLALKSEHNCERIFSFINHSESQALNAFLRPRFRRSQFPTYAYQGKILGQTIHGKYPWAKKNISQLQIVPGVAKHRDALIDYIIKSYSNTYLNPYFNPLFLKNAFDNLVFDYTDFIIALNSDEKIVGCTLPWTMHDLMSIDISQTTLESENFFSVLSLLSIFGMAQKPMTKNLKVKYLSFHRADSHYIHEALLREALKKCDTDEFLFYCFDQNEIHLKRPRYWIGTSVEYGLYELLSTEEAKNVSSLLERNSICVEHPLMF
jgi:hypothetical protein